MKITALISVEAALDAVTLSCFLGVLASRVRGIKTYTCAYFSVSSATHRSRFAFGSRSRARFFPTSMYS